MKKIFVVYITLMMCIFTGKAQSEEEFKPSGKIIARSFFDYSSGLNNKENKSGFDITRAFLGYNYQFAPSLSGRVIIDGASGRSSSGNLETTLRNAYLNWNNAGLDINVGVTGLLQFSTQEDYWKHRYILRSFQDLNRMAPSVDLGVTIKYDFSSFLSSDFSMTNGEGHRKISQDNSTRYALGVDFYPLQNTLFRVYTDIYVESEEMRDAAPEGVTNIGYKNQYTLALLLGYQNEEISFGAEYNRVFNKGFIAKKDYFGYSIYSSVKLNSKWRAFARYDLLDSTTFPEFANPWNSSDGQLVIAGVEFRPYKQLKIAPNIRNINPDRLKSERYIFINAEFEL